MLKGFLKNVTSALTVYVTHRFTGDWAHGILPPCPSNWTILFLPDELSEVLLRERENSLLALTIYHKAIVPNPTCSLREAPKL